MLGMQSVTAMVQSATTTVLQIAESDASGSDDGEEHSREGRGDDGENRWEVGKFASPHTCLAPWISFEHAQVDSNVIAGFIMNMIKKNSIVCIEILRGRFRRANTSVHHTERRGLQSRKPLCKFTKIEMTRTTSFLASFR
ncbi:hypothetical protein PIB30_024765 [Stylosanthes scabra]|uniref:Uncharacterized protein n=1 Tax=Stylosanthes scabra TaxID=79078 RepID=A0ABU6UAW3_9FABA|nr:hypothetical protein [Stylosanthes scabra]